MRTSRFLSRTSALIGLVTLFAAGGRVHAATILQPTIPGAARVLASADEAPAEIVALGELSRRPALADPNIAVTPLASVSANARQPQGLDKHLAEELASPVDIQRGVLRKGKVLDHYVPTLVDVPVYRDDLIRENLPVPVAPVSVQGAY